MNDSIVSARAAELLKTQQTKTAERVLIKPKESVIKLTRPVV